MAVETDVTLMLIVLFVEDAYLPSEQVLVRANIDN